MNEARLRAVLTRFEGCKDIVYKDTCVPPNLTVGIGHMDNKMREGQQIGPSVIDILYKQDSTVAIQVAKKAVGDCFNTLDEGRQINLIQLAFNLGNRLLGFHHMIAAIQSGDFETAANELQNSSWFEQVGVRGPESVSCFRTGKYSWE